MRRRADWLVFSGTAGCFEEEETGSLFLVASGANAGMTSVVEDLNAKGVINSDDQSLQEVTSIR